LAVKTWGYDRCGYIYAGGHEVGGQLWAMSLRSTIILAMVLDLTGEGTLEIIIDSGSYM
jgi:hypothetical protein